MNKNGKYAFVLSAQGSRYVKYRHNVESLIRRYCDGIDVVVIDPKSAAECIGVNADAVAASMIARLAIPLMQSLEKYERIVWIDCDTDIVSADFVDVFDVDTSCDGLAACRDVDQDERIKQLKMRFESYDRAVYFNSGVIVFEPEKIDRNVWRSRILEGLGVHVRNPLNFPDQDILNFYFSIKEIDGRYNHIYCDSDEHNQGAFLVHYAGSDGHDMLDEIIALRSLGQNGGVKDRCVVVSPRHAFIRPWIRAYFATGNTTPLVIVPGPPGDWQSGDMEYCQAAAKFCNGLVFDCSEEWRDSQRLAERAVRRSQVGWFTKKSILHAIAKRLAPKVWAWIDDDAEVMGDLGECFDAAEKAPGFVYTQFYYPGSIDNRHPERTYRSNIDTGDKISWNSFMFFHGEANQCMAEELGKDFPVEDDEIVFCHLYKTNKIWHEGFCDFSIRNWQKNCKYINQIPSRFDGKLLHYTSNRNGGEIKKMWAAKADTLRKAPFEKDAVEKSVPSAPVEDPIDAVFVIGTGSVDQNQELRYALRNLDAHCKFVRNVYICGYCPDWVDKTVVKHLQWPDRFSHAKDANIVDKLRHACEHPGIAKRILFCSDDQFQTRPCTWDDFAPRYLRRYASNDNWYESRRRLWHTRLRKTLEREVQRRQSIGADANDVFYYQPHIWMPIDRDVFIDYARWCGYDHRDDTIIASGYFNFANANGRPDFDHVFLSGNSTGMPEATHVAYHDGSYPIAMRLLRKLFPERCRFEVGGEDAVRADPRIARKEANHSLSNGREITLKPTHDPSPAQANETAEMREMMESVRRNPLWHNLLGEISRAEEVRLFGVRGWRIVWHDILVRWQDAARGGAGDHPIANKRSEDASRIVHDYMSNPDLMRTVRFGTASTGAVAPAEWKSGRQVQRPASLSEREHLRDRVRATLRN